MHRLTELQARLVGLLVAAAVACGGNLRTGVDEAGKPTPDAGAAAALDAGPGAKLDAAADVEAVKDSPAENVSDTANPPVGASVIIVNSGSTNSPGFTITVAPDGHASWHNAPPHVYADAANAIGCGNPLDSGACADGTTTLDAAVASKLFGDLAAAGSFANLEFDQCAKSVSFGTTTSLTYDGATIKDTECGSTTDVQAEALSKDVMAVENAVAASHP